MTQAWPDHWLRRQPFFNAECRSQRDRLIEALSAPTAAQQSVFEDLLRYSRKSLFWRRENFDVDAFDIASFKATVPVRKYADFESLLDMEVRTRGGFLSCSPVLRWLKTSGTTGTPKRIPYTLHWLSAYRVPAIQAMWGTFLYYHPDILAHPLAVLDTQTVREEVSEFLYGVEHQAISNRHPSAGSIDWNPPWYEAPWFRPDVGSDHARRTYCRLRHMIGKDLRFITAINPSTMVSMRDTLLDRAGSLVRDIFEGTIEGEPLCEGNRELAHRLERLLSNRNVSLTEVWPSLVAYSTWTTASARLYDHKMAALFPGLSRMPFMACGTEGVVTIPIDATLNCQPLAVNQAFFEFVPTDVAMDAFVSSGAHEETLSFEEVEEGREYHLIMSQINGLCRLCTGDIYRVHTVTGGVPWLEFVRRDGVYHSFTGEKLTESQLSSAISLGFAQHRCDVGMYLCGPRWGSPPNYVLMVEQQSGPPIDFVSVAAAIDVELCSNNVEYASKRESGRLAGIRVVAVPRDDISRWVERKRRVGNATQFKYQPFQPDTDFLNEIGVGKELLPV